MVERWVEWWAVKMAALTVDWWVGWWVALMEDRLAALMAVMTEYLKAAATVDMTDD